MRPEYKDRMEGLSNEKNLKEASALIHILTQEWVKEGFDVEDVEEYFLEIIRKATDKPRRPFSLSDIPYRNF